MPKKRKRALTKKSEETKKNSVENKTGIKNGFKRFIKKIASKNFFLLLIVFLLAFAVRAHLMQEKYELFFEFDSYFHARQTEYVIKHNSLPLEYKDPNAYYQLGLAVLPQIGPFFWFTNAFFYKYFSFPIIAFCKATIGNSLFTNNYTKFLDVFGCNSQLSSLKEMPLSIPANYNQELLVWWIKFLPAFYGALISIGMFFLFKLVFGRKIGFAVGLATAFMASLVPAFVYRTMAGFYEPSSWGFVFMVYGLYFLFKAIKNPEISRQNLLNAFIGGIILGLFAFAWGFFIVNVIILLAYLPFGLFLVYTRLGKQKLIAFIANFGLTFLVMSIIASLSDSGRWINLVIHAIIDDVPLTDFVFLSGIIFLVFVSGFILFLIYSAAKKNPELKEKYLRLAPTIALYFFVLVLAFLILDPTGFATKKFQATGVLGSTIGEESKGSNAFGEKYNIMIFLPVLALLLLPYRILKKEKEHLSVFFFFWVMVTLVMAWYKLKFTYLFGLPIAVSIGIVLAEFFERYGVNGRQIETRVFALGIGFLLLSAIGAGTMFVTKNVPTIEQQPQWKTAAKWIKENTPKNAKLFNWWSQGHWLAFLTERKVFIDNRNYSFKSNQDFATFVSTNDLNKALSIIWRTKPDYLVLDNSLLNLNSMLVYARGTVNLDPSKPSLRPYFFTLPVPGTNQLRFTNGFYRISCQGGQTVSCQGLSFPIDKYNSLPLTWTSMPNITLDNDDLGVVYKTGNKDNPSILLLSVGVNRAMITRLLLGDPEMLKYFEPVYNKQGIMIYKVKLKEIESFLGVKPK